MKDIDGGITAPRGFRAAGLSRIALVVSEETANAAGVLTTNKVQAAPVRLCRARLENRSAQAIVVNSGNANACTGEQGAKDAEKMAELAAQALGLDREAVLVCSTGVIGVPLPMEKIEKGIQEAAAVLSADGGVDAARAIMTTDTVPKTEAVEIAIDGKPVRIGGMAKGAGMIRPDMATMLAFLTTDAGVAPEALQECLSGSVRKSFNRISVDGDMSTNDTVLFLANGKAGNDVLDKQHPEWDLFAGAVEHITRELALMIVRDGEGATKFVTVQTKGAVSDGDALKVCRAVSDSMLVKTSWFGGDPNWGRVIDAAGYSGAELKEELVDIYYNDTIAVSNGCVAGPGVAGAVENAIAGDEFTLTIDLKLGDGTHTVYTCDCSYDYVKINSEYTS